MYTLILNTRKEIAEYKRKKYFTIGNDTIIVFRDNTTDLKRIEKARWFRVSRNYARIREGTDKVWSKLNNLYDRGFRSLIGKLPKNKRKTDDEWIIFEFDKRHSIGIALSHKYFNFDDSFKLTSFHDINHDLVIEYFKNEEMCNYLYNKNSIISQYLFNCIKSKYYNNILNKNYVEYIKLTINERIYIFKAQYDMKPLILPEDEGTSIITIKE